MKATQQPNEFSALRKRARERRDKVIAQATTDYEAALVQIAMLEQDLMGKESSRHKALSACVESVLPRTESFSLVDVLAALEGLDPGRVWRKASVEHHITRLRERGIVRRLRRHHGREPALYAREGSDVAKVAFEGLTLLEVIRECLTRPMTQTELVMVMLESGYQSTMRKPMLRNRVGEILRTPGNGFQRTDGGKWAAAPIS